MRFLAIHADGYGGEGTWYPAFELEAVDPESPPSSIRALKGQGFLTDEDIQSYLDDRPDLSAGSLAAVTGAQHVGALARALDGMVVYAKGEELDPDDEYHWTELNIPEDSEDPVGDAEELREEWDNSNH